MAMEALRGVAGLARLSSPYDRRMPSALAFTHIFADAQGESHIAQRELPLAPTAFAPPAPPLDVSAVQAATGFEALRFPADWTGGWHNSPHRQWGFILSGAVAVTTSDGATCELRAGGAFLLEDTHGKGHLTRVIGGTEVLWVAVQIPRDAPTLTA
jgi:hypothetical protein